MPTDTLSASLRPHKAQILLGEPVHLTYELQNSGEGELQFREGGNQRNRFGRYDDYNLVVVDESGKALAVLDSAPNFGGRSWAPKVSAAKSFKHDLFLPHWVELPSVGTFTIRSERSFTVRTAGTDAWHGETGEEVKLQAETTIEVLPADPAAMGLIIEAVGQELFGKDEGPTRTQAWRNMSAIDDERVIPWLCRGIDSQKYGFISSSLSALEKFPADAAVACIKKVMTIRGAELTDEFTTPELAEGSANNLRQHVAHTLSASPHPDAFSLLLSMSTDDYESVRLTVLHEIARRLPKDARQRITAFTKDKSEMVRGEAARYLSEL
jgi:hypothetical protein